VQAAKTEAEVVGTGSETPEHDSLDPTAAADLVALVLRCREWEEGQERREAEAGLMRRAGLTGFESVASLIAAASARCKTATTVAGRRNWGHKRGTAAGDRGVA
jgi:hypothetical protein